MRKVLLGLGLLLFVSSGCDAGIDLVASLEVAIVGDGASARVLVTATRDDGTPITDALVDAAGVPLPGGAGGYTGQIAWAAAWDVTFMWHGNLLRRHVVAPGTAAVTVTPDPPRVGQPAVLSWPGTAVTTACVSVNGGAEACAPDTGHADLPGTAFPAAGSYDLAVGRTLAGADGRATLVVHVVRNVT